MKHLIKKSTAAVAFALLVAACGSDQASTIPQEPRLLLVAENVGSGLYHPYDLFQPKTPWLALYSDGMFVMLDRADEVKADYTTVRFRTGSLDDIMSAARKAGLKGPDRDLGFAGVADAGGLVISLYHQDGTHTTVANGFSEFDSDTFTEEQRQARLQLRDFLDQLITPGDWWLDTTPEPYVPDEWAAVVAEIREPDPPFEPRYRPWPFSVVPGDTSEVTFNARVRCLLLDGPTATSLGSDLAPGDLWTYEAAEFYVYLRPLLRHEAGDCSKGTW